MIFNSINLLIAMDKLEKADKLHAKFLIGKPIADIAPEEMYQAWRLL